MVLLAKRSSLEGKTTSYRISWGQLSQENILSLGQNIKTIMFMEYSASVAAIKYNNRSIMFLDTPFSFKMCFPCINRTNVYKFYT